MCALGVLIITVCCLDWNCLLKQNRSRSLVSFTQKVSLSRISQPLKVQTILLHLLYCDTFMSFRWPLFAILKQNHFLNDWKWHNFCIFAQLVYHCWLLHKKQSKNNDQLEAIYSIHPSIFCHAEKTLYVVFEVIEAAQVTPKRIWMDCNNIINEWIK